MRYLTKHFSRCLCVLALFASTAAQALPTYQVRVDTAGFDGRGILDFNFLANAGATPASAILSNFVGDFGAAHDRSPSVVGAMPGRITLSNQDGGAYLSQYVNLGGILSFLVRFGGAFAATDNIDGSQFAATLYNEDLTGYIGVPGSLVEFSLLPQTDGQPGGVEVVAVGPLASVTATSDIPEPSSMLLMLGAVAMLGAGHRARTRLG